MLELILDEVLSDLDSTTDVLEQVDQGNPLLIHPAIDADQKRLGALQASNELLLQLEEAQVHTPLALHIHL